MDDFEYEPVETSKKAVSSFVLGLFSMFCSIITGIPAVILGIWALIDIGNSEGRLTGKGFAVAGIAVPMTVGMIAPLMIALLLPAVQAAREAARLNMSMNNMKQISLGMLNFESSRGRFPAAGEGLEGPGAGLSWRVHLLPYLDHETLYKEFKLDEPWDSEHNKQLIARMPEIYSCPGHDDGSGKTMYLVPTGKKAMFAGGVEGPSMAGISDGLSNTVMLIEVNPETAVEWTKPDDWDFDPSDPARDLGGARYGGVCLIGFVDAHVERIDVKSVSPETLFALFTPNGDEPIDEAF